jgi:hypothetical protein
VIILYLLLNILSTTLLIVSISGLVSYYKMKFSVDLFLSCLIGLLFIISAITTSISSLSFFLFYGIISLLFVWFLISAGSKPPLSVSIPSALVSFFFWPQTICFLIFVIQHQNDMKKDELE